MVVKINTKIVKYSVVEQKDEDEVVYLHEKVQRPTTLKGVTYKVKTPLYDHALYLTINDIVLNKGTDDEIRRPFEIFINSKNMEHFQWIVALTRIISAVFRKGGDITFLVDELRCVFDPKGGYFKKGGKYKPSLVAEIGDVIAEHLTGLGILPSEEITHGKEQEIKPEGQGDAESGGFPASATLCNSCMFLAVVVSEGCSTCLNCGDSKCG